MLLVMRPPHQSFMVLLYIADYFKRVVNLACKMILLQLLEFPRVPNQSSQSIMHKLISDTL